MPNQRLLRYFWPLLLLLLMFGSQSCLPPRCIKFPQYAQCHARMMHRHSGMAFRGVPWYQKQHLQYGDKYKPQPGSGHGETVVPKNPRKEGRKRVVIKME